MRSSFLFFRQFQSNWISLIGTASSVHVVRALRCEDGERVARSRQARIDQGGSAL